MLVTFFKSIMYSSTPLIGLVAMAATVFAHGLIISPAIRVPGPAMDAVCGISVSALVRADNASHVEGLPEALALEAKATAAAAACNPFLCKGLQFADNTANVQNFTAGQVVNMRASIPIPHEGPMNVSIIDTETNTAIGAPLISFASYADEALATLPANNTNFNVSIPATLDVKCAVAGACVSGHFGSRKVVADTYIGHAMVLVRNRRGSDI